MRLVPLLLAASICWLAAGAGPVAAQDAAPLSSEEKQLLQDRAKALRDKASLMRQDAELRLAADNKACWDKILVSKCQDEAKAAKIETLAAARRLEQEAREIEHKLRSRNVAEHETHMAAEAPQHAADAATQAEKNRQAQQEAMERVERKRLEAEQREKH